MSPADISQNPINAALDSLLGPDLANLMHRPDITEIYCNEDGIIRYISQNEGKVKTKMHFLPDEIRAIIELIAGQSGENGKIVNSDIPSVSTEIRGYGARFQGEIPPIVRNPQFNIRKPALKIFTLNEFVENGTLSPAYKEYILSAIRERKNILISGGTGTGKTTFLNAVLDSVSTLCPYHRIISLEDLPEIQCHSDDYSAMFTQQETNSGKIRYDMTRLLADCMRRSPDRIIVGEVRDKAAYTMLKAWNTGHPGGVCTVHANSAELALTRIRTLAREDPDAAGDIDTLIGEAIDAVIFIEYTSLGGSRKGRVVNDIIQVDKFDESTQQFIISHISNR